MVSKKVSQVVTPAKAGVQKTLEKLDSRLRGNDRKTHFSTFYEAVKIPPAILPYFISGLPKGGYPALASSFLICSTLVFVSSNTIVALWFTALESTDFTPSIRCAVILTCVEVSPQTHPGILNFTVFSAASTLPAAPNPKARITANAITIITLVLIGSPPSYFCAYYNG